MVAGVPGAIQSVERAAAILQLVAESSAPLGLTDVAESLDLAKATTHGLLRTLQDVGFLVQDEASGKYAIGPGLLDLAHARVDPHDLRSHAMNWADSLASRSGESVRIAALVDGAPTIVHHVFRPDDTLQRLENGLRMPRPRDGAGQGAARLGRLSPGPAGPRVRPVHPAHGDRPRVLTRALVDVRRLGWSCDIRGAPPGRGVRRGAGPRRRRAGGGRDRHHGSGGPGLRRRRTAARAPGRPGDRHRTGRCCPATS